MRSLSSLVHSALFPSTRVYHATIVVPARTSLHGLFFSDAAGAFWCGYTLFSYLYWLLSIIFLPIGIAINMMLSLLRLTQKVGRKKNRRYWETTGVSFWAGLFSLSGDIVSTGGRTTYHMNTLNHPHTGKNQSGNQILTVVLMNITSLSVRTIRNKLLNS